MSDAHSPDQEPDLLPTAWIVRALLGTLVVLTLGVIGSWWMLRHSERSFPRPARGGPWRSGPVGLEVTPIERDSRSAALRHQQKKQLESYGWVNRQGGIARIPIERALELTVERSK